MVTCDACGVQVCRKGGKEGMPKNCPMQDDAFFEETFAEYQKPENHDFFVISSEIEQMGYGVWPRLREVIEFAKRAGYHKLGLAFCAGLREEAKVVAAVLRQHGFVVASVICKTGGIDKECAGVPKERKLNPGRHESMCNPISQAELLNRENTEFNIVLGLCVGHDSLFYKYTDALATTLVAKDRVMAHNPVGAIYNANGYAKEKLDID